MVDIKVPFKNNKNNKNKVRNKSKVKIAFR